MNKTNSTNQLTFMDSSVAGRSKSMDHEEMDLSVPDKYAKDNTRKRVNVADNVPSKGTTSKQRRVDSNADTSKLDVNEGLKLNSSDPKSGSTQTNIKSIDDLTPEMLETVLNHMTTVDLIKCRQVNRKWNELSSRMLHHRKDLVLRFSFDHFISKQFKKRIRIGRSDLMGYGGHKLYIHSAKSLTDFTDCIETAKYFPYTSFNIGGDLKYFENEDMKRFLLIWGKEILSLKIVTFEPVKTVDSLRKLLLQQVPNLNKLEIQFHNNNYPGYFTKEKSIPIQLFVDAEMFQLPKLEVLVTGARYRTFRGIIENILAAAINLKEFVYNAKHSEKHDRLFENSITTDDLIMLQSLNKLQCLKAIKICLTEDFITYWIKSSLTLDLKVQSLHLSFGEIWGNEQLKFDATSVVNQLLESNKHVMKTLAMEPMGLLPQVVFPKLEKLHLLDLLGTPDPKVKLEELHLLDLFGTPDPQVGFPKLEELHLPDTDTTYLKRTMFPQPFECADVFPNLKELDMNTVWTDDYFPPSQPPFLMPSIEVLRIEDLHNRSGSPESNEKLMKMTPNVKTLVVTDYLTNHHDESGVNDERFINAFRIIVNHLTKLETFGWVIWRGTHHELLYKLDAAITGLPVDFCKTMSVMLRNKKRLSPKELASIEPHRKHSSILNLKALKKLDVTFLFDSDAYGFLSEYGNKKYVLDEAGYRPAHGLHETGFTKVSELLAFQLMPNLKVRINKEVDS